MSRKRKIYVIGDSISLHYGPYLQESLGEGYDVLRRKDEAAAYADLDMPQGANSGDSQMVLALIKARLRAGEFIPDLLLLNCGLHDIKRTSPGSCPSVPIEQYRQNLNSIASLLKTSGPEIAWVSTTPFSEAIHNRGEKIGFWRFEREGDAYHQVAIDVMGAYGIPVFDLRGFTAKLGPIETLLCDHVHFTEDVRRQQGAFLASSILNWFRHRDSVKS